MAFTNEEKMDSQKHREFCFTLAHLFLCVCVFYEFFRGGRGGCALNTRNIFANAPTVCPTTHLRNIGHDYPGGKTRYKRDSKKKIDIIYV